MTIADWCILAAALLPLITLAPVKTFDRGGYDNADPRAPGFYRDGLRARAWGAHLNGFEAFPFFAAAILLSEMRHAPQGMIDALAAGYVAVRLGYLAAYLGGRPALRSALWAVGLLLNIGLMVLPALAAR